MKPSRHILVAFFLLVRSLSAQIVNDGATNTLSNVTNTITGDVTVGTNGSFTLLVLSDNALLTNSGDGTIGFNTTAKSNEVRLASPSARWQVGGTFLNVGSNGAFNRLVVSNGAMVQDNFVILGRNLSASNNLALVTGSGSVWSNGIGFWLGLDGGGNQLVVSNGGVLRNDNNSGYIGLNLTGSNNLAVVTGSGSTWINADALDLYVGLGGAGNQLLVSNGGAVRNGHGYVGANPTASNNLALITGSGSVWSNALDLDIGFFSANNNQMIVSNGATVFTAGHGFIGADTNANANSVTVTDPGSGWLVSTNLYVGSNGALNRLVVSNRATVFVNSNSYIGFNTNSTGNVVLVTGPGSLWTNALELDIGYEGSRNQLVVSNGAAVYAGGDGVLGFNSGSQSNTVTVTGPGSLWSNGDNIFVGRLSSSGNRVVVTNGGTLYGAGPGLIGVNGPLVSANTVTVTGAGSLWTNTDYILVGLVGTGNRLDVNDGGVVRSLRGEVGNHLSTSDNVALVTGSGSLWSNDTTLVVGVSGPRSQLVVSNGGTVAASESVTVGNTAFSTNNRVVVDGGTLCASNALGTGTLDVRRGTNVLNAGLIDVDQSVLTNTLGKFEFNGGTLITRGGFISNTLPFVVGRSGTTPGVWDVRAGSNHLVSGQVIVGDTSSFNQLVLTNGGLLTNSGISVLGQSAGANSNSATIAGAGSRWLQLNGVIIGGLGSGNRLTVSNGATLLNSGGSSYIGNDLASSNNEALITAPGTTWTSSSSINVGEGGHDNRLLVSAGAQVTSFAGTIGDLFAGTSNNVATVTGAGSSWNADTFNVGFSGAGNQLVVSNSGLVAATNFIYLGLIATSTKNRLTVDTGTLRVTNATATGLLEIRRGTNVLNSGLIEADIVRMTNSPQSVFEFNGGTLSAKSSRIGSGTIFRIGNGVSPATMILAGNGLHDFSLNLLVQVSSNAVLTGNGTLAGGISILSGAALIPGSSVGKMIFTNAPFLQGSVLMEISKNGETLTNDQIQAITGTLTYGGTLVVTNLGPTTLATGDRFPLFSATNYAGSFSSISLPPLAAGLDWTNKLLVDGSIEVFTLPPADRFWTNALGGNYDVAANWLSDVVPFPQDTANFTSNASYQVAWPASALAANAFFNASGGAVTQAIGAASWILTNSYVLGQNPGATAAVTHVSGSLRVTNAVGTAQLKVGAPGRGTFTLAGGEVITDSLFLTNGFKSVFNFAGGALRSRNTTTGPAEFIVGSAASSATFELLGGTHSFGNGVRIQPNAVLAGNGTLVGPVVIWSAGTLSPGVAQGGIGKMILSNAPTLLGAVLMEISKTGATFANDQVQLVAGTLTYGGSLIVSNLGPTALANGDRFQLFSATNYGVSSFDAITLPPLGQGLSWKNNLLTDGSLEVFAPPAIPLSSGSYTQNFDSLASSGSVLWQDNSTLLGWYAAKSTSMPPLTFYIASDGSDGSGALYSFGSAGSVERALGSIASDSFGDVAYGLCFTNDTANSVSNFIITYTGEQWRSASSGMSVTNTLTFWYRLSPSVITNPEPGFVTNWTQVTNLGFVSPKVLGGPAGTPLDGNQAANRHVFSAVLIPGLVVPPGQHVFFRWRDSNDAGPDQGMALDDLIISFAPLPTDRFWTNPLGGSYEVAANWLSNIVAQPPDTARFTSNATYQVNWATDALAANAFFDAGSGAVTQAIGAASWTLTNSYIVGQDSAATAAVTHASGSLRVTNSAGTAKFKAGEMGRGTFNLSGGEVIADNLLVTNGSKSVFNFTGGTLRSRNTTVNNGSRLTVGTNTTAGTFELLGGTHTFANGLTIQSNSLLAGTGDILANVTVNGSISPGGAQGGIGQLNFNSGALNFSSTTTNLFEINKAAGTNDTVTCVSIITLNGTLIVTNLGGTLTSGDRFQLFSGSFNFFGFQKLILPPLSAGLSWKNDTHKDGSIQVIETPARDFGEDVSHFQGDISQSIWNQMFAEGKRFAFIKATEGLTGPNDLTMSNNVARAAAAGLLAGVYHLAHPENRPTTNGAISEATNFLSWAGSAIGPGRLRPVLDLEFGSGLTTTELTDWVIAFSNEIINNRGPAAAPIIYTIQSFAQNELDSRLANYDLWLAAYSGGSDPQADDPPPFGLSTNALGVFNNWSFWQYSDTGSSGGISPLDLDVCHSEYKPLSSYLIPGPPPAPIQLSIVGVTGSGAFQLSFTNTPGSFFAVLATTNPSLPSSNWIVVGPAIETSPGQFQFTDPQATNNPQRFYRVRSP